MKFLSCPFCGKRVLDEEAPYCPYCRKELRLTATPPNKPKVAQMNYWICPNCKAVNPNEERVCHNCKLQPISYGSSLDTFKSHPSEYYDKPSNVWYLVAFLFGLLGGLIAYVAVRDKDGNMANACVYISVVTTLIGGAVVFYSLGII